MEDGRTLQANPTLFNRIYGHVIPARDVPGELTGAWLQYWVFYYYNNFEKFGIGKHEGDWEMIMVRLDAYARPLFSAYAQHNKGSLCSWTDTERTGRNHERPVVYVGGGSHASYFTAGTHNIEGVPGGDEANGKGWRDTSAKLRVAGNSSPRWVNWPGVWGGSRGAKTGSPDGPKFQGPWSNPQAFIESIAGVDSCK